MLPEFKTRRTKKFFIPYAIRHADEDRKEPASLERSVVVNHYRTLFFAEPIPAMKDVEYIILAPEERNQVRK